MSKKLVLSHRDSIKRVAVRAAFGEGYWAEPRVRAWTLVRTHGLTLELMCAYGQAESGEDLWFLTDGNDNIDTGLLEVVLNLLAPCKGSNHVRVGGLNLTIAVEALGSEQYDFRDEGIFSITPLIGARRLLIVLEMMMPILWRSTEYKTGLGMRISYTLQFWKAQGEDAEMFYDCNSYDEIPPL